MAVDKYDIFISHMNIGQDLAVILQESIVRFSNNKLRVFCSRVNLKGGDLQDVAIQMALRESRIVAILATHGFTEWVNSCNYRGEILLAVDQARENPLLRRVVPIATTRDAFKDRQVALAQFQWILAWDDVDLEDTARQLVSIAELMPSMELACAPQPWRDSTEELLRVVRDASSQTLTFLHTWFAHVESFFPPFIDAIANNNRLTTLRVMLPSVAVLEARIRHRIESFKTSQNALLATKVRIARLASDIKRVRHNFEVEVVEYNHLPFGPVFSVGDAVVFGIYPPDRTSDDGPLIVTRGGSWVATILQDGLETVWNEQSAGDGSRPGMVPARFMTASLWQSDFGHKIGRVLWSGVAKVHASMAVRASLRAIPRPPIIEGGATSLKVTVGESSEYTLVGRRTVNIIALGKAAAEMAAEARKIIPPSFMGESLVVSKTSQSCEKSHSGAGVNPSLFGSHPDPDEHSERAGASLRQFVGRIERGDLVLVLLSGGGSSLAVSVPDGLELNEVRDIWRDLREAGAGISETNEVRRCTCSIKGGMLAEEILGRGAVVATIAISDIPNDSVPDIASGPTALNSRSPEKAAAVLERYGMAGGHPSAFAYLKSLRVDRRYLTQQSPIDVVLGNRRFRDNLSSQAYSEGFSTVLINSPLVDLASAEAEKFAKFISEVSRRFSKKGRKRAARRNFSEVIRHESFESCIDTVEQMLSVGPTVVVAGGEPRTQISSGKGARGRGGRTTDLVLRLAKNLSKGYSPLIDFLVVALASDGDDGTSGASGCVGSPALIERFSTHADQTDAALRRHDSASVFADLDDLIGLGPTGTNVNDAYLLFFFPRQK